MKRGPSTGKKERGGKSLSFHFRLAYPDCRKKRKEQRVLPWKELVVNSISRRCRKKKKEGIFLCGIGGVQRKGKGGASNVGNEYPFTIFNNLASGKKKKKEECV